MDAEEEIKKRAERMSKEDVGDAIKNEGKSERMVKENSFLRQYWRDIKTSYSLLRDWYMGTYKKIPYRMALSIAAGLVYLGSPLDVIPDWLPLGGLLDDALVLAAVFGMARKDIDEYEFWKRSDLK